MHYLAIRDNRTNKCPIEGIKSLAKKHRRVDQLSLVR